MDIENSKKFFLFAASPFLGSGYRQVAEMRVHGVSDAGERQRIRENVYANWQTLVDDFAARTNVLEDAVRALPLPADYTLEIFDGRRVTRPLSYGEWPTFKRIAEDDTATTIQASHDGHYGQPLVFFGVARTSDLDKPGKFKQLLFGLASDGTLAIQLRTDDRRNLSQPYGDFNEKAEVIGSIHDRAIMGNIVPQLAHLSDGQAQIEAERGSGGVRALASRLRSLIR